MNLILKCHLVIGCKYICHIVLHEYLKISPYLRIPSSPISNFHYWTIIPSFPPQVPSLHFSRSGRLELITQREIFRCIESKRLEFTKSAL